jgi:hypothetical protein
MEFFKVLAKIFVKDRFTVSELSCEFPEMSRAISVLKMLTGAQAAQRMARALVVFRAMPQGRQ